MIKRIMGQERQIHYRFMGDDAAFFNFIFEFGKSLVLKRRMININMGQERQIHYRFMRDILFFHLWIWKVFNPEKKNDKENYGSRTLQIRGWYPFLLMTSIFQFHLWIWKVFSPEKKNGKENYGSRKTDSLQINGRYHFLLMK